MTYRMGVVVGIRFAAGAAAFFAWAGVDTARGGTLSMELVQSGFTSPVYATYAPGDPTRLFIVEKGTGAADSATIKILNLADLSVNATPFLTVTNAKTDGEQGLLGMAFDPNYQTNGRFYVNVNTPAGAMEVRRYTVSGDPNIADPLSGTPVLTMARTTTTHNGGWIGFSPNDGYLYIMSGDGGTFNDPDNNAQNKDSLLGKVLRIDVNGTAQGNYSNPTSNPFYGATAGADEVWAYGMRNPWRASFDPSGNLWIGDVGQDHREEIDFQPASSVGGENYGWRVREGFTKTTGIGDPDLAPEDRVDPIFDYDHAGFTNASILGGYVYRGPIDPDLLGTYFFADTNNGILATMNYDGVNPPTVVDISSIVDPGHAIGFPVSFGEDMVGNLYVVDFDGQVFRLVPEPGSLVLLLSGLAALGMRGRAGRRTC